MSPPEKLIAVAGANGRLGRLIVASLLTHPEVRVRALVRDPARAADLASDRVEVQAFDLTDPADHARAVDGAWAVVSTLQGGPDVIVDGQLALLRAAKAGGARRFLPSDYSYDHFALPEGMNVNSDWRRELARRAASEVTASFEVVHVLQGIFADAYVLGFLGVFDGTNVRFWGDGRTPIDWTTWEDTARFAAAAACDPRQVPSRLHVAGDRQDIHGFAAAFAQVHGRTLTLERLGSLDELAALTRARLQATPHDMYAWLPLMYAQGVFGGQALLGPLHNGRYPDIQPETLADAMRRGVIA